MHVEKNLVDRKHWPEGPWDGEPDLVIDGRMLFYRMGNGVWGVLVRLNPDESAKASKLHQTKQKFEDRHIEFVTFDGHSKHADVIDKNKTYAGVFFNKISDVKPAEMRWMSDVPDYMRDKITQTFDKYVTLEKAKTYGAAWQKFLSEHGCLSTGVDSST